MYKSHLGYQKFHRAVQYALPEFKQREGAYGKQTKQKKTTQEKENKQIPPRLTSYCSLQLQRITTTSPMHATCL